MSIAARIIESRGLVAVEKLAMDAGISSRQLERRFLSDIGVGPKLLGRIIRFQQVFRAVEQSNSAWAEIALACGYYDQAHLIRDFNQFAQQTPALLFSNQSVLTESFTRKSRKSDFYNTPG
jgi:transcriptional regulator GlxA family with amidase domain